MKYPIFFIIIILITALPIYNIYSEDIEEEEKAIRFIPFPILGYSPNTGVIGGGGMMLTWDNDLSTRENQKQFFSVTAMYTQKKQAVLGIGTKNWFFDDWLELSTDLTLFDFSEEMWEIGNSGLKEGERYNIDYISGKFSAGVETLPNFYAGPKYEFAAYRVDDSENNKYLSDSKVVGSDGGFISAPGIYVKYDSTDKKASPLKGIRLKSGVLTSSVITGSDFTFNVFDNEAAIYKAFFKDHVIAGQLKSDLSSGNVPFRYLPQLGGSEVLRGYKKGRFKDNFSISSQIEYRSPYIWRIGFTSFIGAGKVSENIPELFTGDYHIAGGGGIRFAIDKDSRLNLRIDIAVTDEGSVGFYIRGREAF